MNSFTPLLPFPSHKSYLALRQQIVDYLLKNRPACGAPFPPETQLARDSGLARPTVRKALNELCLQGWLERRPGVGLFVGPRTAFPGSPIFETKHSRIGRVGVIVSMFRDGHMDWFHTPILEGLDEAASEQGLSVELIGSRATDLKGISQRLMQHRYDLVISTTHSWPELMALAEARRQGITCLNAGSRTADWDISNVYEDNEQGTALAVQHLVGNGHQNIGFVQVEDPALWVFDRRRGFLQAMVKAGITLEKNPVLWLDLKSHGTWSTQMEIYLKALRPTAMIFGASASVQALSRLLKRGWRVPAELSVVVIGQDDAVRDWLGGVQPATVQLPLREIGRKAGQMARQLIDTGDIEKEIIIPCTLQPGDSVLKR